MTFIPSYVGIDFDDRGSGKILAWERDEAGNRVEVLHEPRRYFFVPAEADEELSEEFTSMFGDRLKKLSFSRDDEFKRAKRAFPKKFESDIGLIERVLMDEYYNRPVPKFNYGFFDIESEIIKGRGFSRPVNAFAPINAITVYKQWLDTFVCIAVPPPGYDKPTFDINLTQYGYAEEKVKLILVKDEAELLSLFLEHLRDFDFISGWNSHFYDMPYIYSRIVTLFGEKYANQLNFPNAGEVKVDYENKGGTKKRLNDEENKADLAKAGMMELVVKLRGRTHMDYMDMFKKFTFEGRESYALNAISAEEVNAVKLEHIGLYRLYHEQFEKFVHYNLIDVILIKMIDLKFKFVNLVNQMAHENTVVFDAILGTTKYVDTGITNFAHHVVGVRVKDKDIVQKNGKVEGAIVLTPNKGLHEWVGSVDINSLYPSIIRSLNLSPEKVLGQFDTDATRQRMWENEEFRDIVNRAIQNNEVTLRKRPDARDLRPDIEMFKIAAAREEDWRGIMAGDSYEHTCHLVDESVVTLTGAEWKNMLIANGFALTAYGTLINEAEGSGIMPRTLEFWYSERLRLQAEKKKWTKKVKELEKAKASKKEIAYAKAQEEHYDLLQLTKKIQLNSAYGALLAAGFRWGAENIGASVTYSGRAVTDHMCSTIGETISSRKTRLLKSHDVSAKGEIANIYISTEPCVIYSDTDSCYFATGADNKAEAIEIADGIADLVNDSFQEFMQSAFNCQPEFDTLIKAGREVVAERGLFQARKKYMLKVVDLDGFPVEKFKAQGSEIKKSDTPKVIQKFLKSTVDMILDGKPYPEVEIFVNNERKRLFTADLDVEDILLFGTTKAANELLQYEKAYDAELIGRPLLKQDGKTKITIPGHVRAAINFNKLVEEFEGADGTKISTGDKVKVFNLKANSFEFKTLAIPAEADEFPEWFFEYFQIDLSETEEKLIDKKLLGIFEAWGYEVPTAFLAHVNRIIEW